MDKRGTVVAEFVDRYGDTRKVKLIGKRRVAVSKNNDTTSHHLNRAAAVLIAANVKAARLNSGLTLEDLCIRAGLKSANPKNRMWEIENAQRETGLRIGTLYAIALALGCEAADLLPTAQQVQEASGAFVTTQPTLTVNAAA